MSEKPRSIEEAEAEVKRLTAETLPDFFCPLINGACNASCTCIGKPYLSGANQKHMVPATLFHVHQWYCANAMFTGYRESDEQ